MTDQPVIGHNQRKCRCARCMCVLLKGEGIQHRYVMFAGRGEFYYYCPKCDVIAAQEVKEIEERLNSECEEKSHG